MFLPFTIALTVISVVATSEVAMSATVFTANENENSVSIIDSETGSSSKLSLSFSPHNVDLTADRRILLVTGMTAMKMGDTKASAHPMGQLLVADVSGANPVILGEYSVGVHPAHVVAAQDGKTLYISDAAANTVLVFDLSEKRISTQITVGEYPHGLRLSPDGKTLAVANLKGNSVSLINVSNNRELKRIPTGRGPVQVAFTPAGDRLLVALNGQNQAVLLDTENAKAIQTFTIGRRPVQVFITPDSETGIIANQGTKSNPDNRISFVSLKASKNVKMLQTGAGSHGVFISSDGKQAFVTNSFDNTLSIIDVPAQKVLKTFQTGRGPNGVVVR